MFIMDVKNVILNIFQIKYFVEINLLKEIILVLNMMLNMNIYID